MRRAWVRRVFLAGAVATFLATSLPSGHAFHFYRSTESGCAPADGARSDDPVGTVANVTASVVVGHNTFGDGLAGTGLSVSTLLTPHATRIRAGESITWTWSSAHCHSVTSSDLAGTTPLFDSGFLYPTAPPESPQVLPGVFEYPILDATPTLSYTHTFLTPGTYEYFCVHHASIGMNGVVIVE
jgi:plastocyanin